MKAFPDMASWSAKELDVIAAAEELNAATEGPTPQRRPLRLTPR
jgi:hypothetical protein